MINCSYALMKQEMKVLKQKKTSIDVFFDMAVSKRFELLMPFDIHAFQACSFGHSDSSPKLFVRRSTKLGAYLNDEVIELQAFYSSTKLSLSLIPVSPTRSGV